MEVAARSAAAGQMAHSGGHGDLVPQDQLIRDMPGAHPITSIATLNLKDLRTSPGTAGCGCPGRTLRQARAPGRWPACAGSAVAAGTAAAPVRLLRGGNACRGCPQPGGRL
jgi:hypothetical protein